MDLDDSSELGERKQSTDLLLAIFRIHIGGALFNPFSCDRLTQFAFIEEIAK